MQSKFTNLTFVQVNCCENEFAHRLAWIGLHSNPMLWLNNYPPWILRLATSEKSLLIPKGDVLVINVCSFSSKKIMVNFLFKSRGNNFNWAHLKRL